jgi:hypothetical protein
MTEPENEWLVRAEEHLKTVERLHFTETKNHLATARSRRPEAIKSDKI